MKFVKNPQKYQDTFCFLILMTDGKIYLNTKFDERHLFLFRNYFLTYIFR